MSEFSYLYNVFNSLTGLQRPFYDASMGYLPTVERIHYAHFSAPYTKSLTSYMYTKSGVQLDFAKLTEKTIGKYPIF